MLKKKILLKLTVQAQKKRLSPKNQNTRKWKNSATVPNNQTRSGLNKTSGNTPSHRMKAQLHKNASQGFLNTLSVGKGPYRPLFKKTVRACPLRHSGRFNLTQPDTK